MDLTRKPSPVTLSKGRSITLNDAASTVIHCHLGSLWVTQNNDIRDVVLEVGGQFRPDRKGPVLIHALTNARVSCSSDAPQRVSRWNALTAWLVPRLLASVASRHPAIE